MVILLRVSGYILVVLGLGFIIVGSLAVLVFDGFWEFIWLFSPFNWANYIMVLLTMAPGFLLLSWSDKLDENRKLNTKSEFVSIENKETNPVH